jgi:DNA-3-methyladenine glycosylase I
MIKPNSYCDYVNSLRSDDNVHKIYHDNQYGFPIDSDNELFCRLVLEINQAGLSWTTILNKQEGFRDSYSNFEISTVANYEKKQVERLLNDSGVIRNKLKINAAIYNAKKILELQESYGSFKNWLDYSHPMSLDSWIILFKKTFKFTGGEITNEFLTSTGYLPGAHMPTCKIFDKVIRKNPIWNINK